MIVGNEIISLSENESDKINNESLNSNTNSTTSTNDGWIIINHRHGFTIELPNYFKVGVLTASGII